MKLFQSQKLNKFKEAPLRKKGGIERQGGMGNIIGRKSFAWGLEYGRIWFISQG